jgi:hypothetical protein
MYLNYLGTPWHPEGQEAPRSTRGHPGGPQDDQGHIGGKNVKTIVFVSIIYSRVATRPPDSQCTPLALYQNHQKPLKTVWGTTCVGTHLFFNAGRKLHCLKSQTRHSPAWVNHSHRFHKSNERHGAFLHSLTHLSCSRTSPQQGSH